MGRFNEVQDLVNSLEADFEKFYEKGNNAAGTRVRKGHGVVVTTAMPMTVKLTDCVDCGARTRPDPTPPSARRPLTDPRLLCRHLCRR